MSVLFLNDLFWTFQMEGARSGWRALFVRMPNCNLSCDFCDTKWDTHEKIDIETFKAFAQQEKSRFAVITGGEPMMHKHTPIVVSILKELGFEIATETNGNFPIVDGIDFVTCSPKRDAKYLVHQDSWSKVNEFKYVVDDGFDFSVLDAHKDQDGSSPSLRLSPEFGSMKETFEKISEYAKQNPKWKISLQGHKWVGIP